MGDRRDFRRHHACRRHIYQFGQRVRLDETWQAMTSLDDVVLYPGDGAVRRGGLWASDGTPAGTHLVMDIGPGPAASTSDRSSRSAVRPSSPPTTGPVSACGPPTAPKPAPCSLAEQGPAVRGPVRRRRRPPVLRGRGRSPARRTDGGRPDEDHAKSPTSCPARNGAVDRLVGKPDGRVAFVAYSFEVLGEEPYVERRHGGGHRDARRPQPPEGGRPTSMWAGPGVVLRRHDTRARRRPWRTGTAGRHPPWSPMSTPGPPPPCGTPAPSPSPAPASCSRLVASTRGLGRPTAPRPGRSSWPAGGDGADSMGAIGGRFPHPTSSSPDPTAAAPTTSGAATEPRVRERGHRRGRRPPVTPRGASAAPWATGSSSPSTAPAWSPSTVRRSTASSRGCVLASVTPPPPSGGVPVRTRHDRRTGDGGPPEARRRLGR